MNKIILSSLFFTLFLLISCKDNLPIDKDLTKKNYNLINQNGEAIVFPKIIDGHLTVMGFIYTYCPDICPMTIHNMHLTQKQLQGQGITNVKFIALSFDPERDTPEVLNQFAEVRGLELSSWTLLTGEKNTISDLMRRFDVKAVKTDETTDENGNHEYSMMHTDRISLIDSKGQLRKNYTGSTVNIEELIHDIKTLED